MSSIDTLLQGPPRIDRGRLRAAVEDAFTELALHPTRDFHFMSGRPLAHRLGYTSESLEGVPEEAIASFAGVGNPLRSGAPNDGDVVLDVGCGAGVDVLIAARYVGAQGRVVGVDMTPAMVERARQCVAATGVPNVDIQWGHAEALPFPDSGVDLVISNACVSLTPSKVDTFRELFRVLRPGGRLQLADVVVEWRLPRHVVEDLKLWTDCIAGATALDDYPALLEEAGFSEIEMVGTVDAFAGTEVERRSSIFAARGAMVRARKV